MEHVGDGIFEASVNVTSSSAKFKIRKDKSWDVNYGGTNYSGSCSAISFGEDINFKVTGNATVRFDVNKMMIYISSN